MGTPNSIGEDYSDPDGCVESKVCDWYWKRKDVTQGDWVECGRVYDLVSCAINGIVVSRVSAIDGVWQIGIRAKPFEDPIDTETPESPLAIAPPISLSESTPPVFVPILLKIACMVVRVPHAMSSGLSATMAELVEDSEEDDNKEDKEIEESMDSDSVTEGAKDEGPTAEDEDLAAEDEGPTMGVKGPGIDDEGYGLDDESHGRDDESRGIDHEGHSVKGDGLGLEEEEEAVPGGQQQATSVVGTTVSAPLGLGYGALRCRELALEESDVYSTFEVGQGSRSAPESERPKRVSAFRQPTLTTWTDPEDGMIYIDIPDYPPPVPPVQIPPSPEWTSGSLPISPSHSDVSSPTSSLMIPLNVPSPVATPAAHDWRSYRLLYLRGTIGTYESYSLGRGRLGRRFSPRGQTDAQRAALWHAISDVQGENQNLQLQLAEERRAQLELAEVVDGMRRGQEPRGGA
ncbi:hypothetical protein Tco_1346919 [Tanacetum coccineum]